MQQLATNALTDEKSNLTAVLGAVHDLELSHRYPTYILDASDGQLRFSEVMCYSAKFCTLKSLKI